MYCIFENPANEWDAKIEECVGIINQSFNDKVWYDKVLPLIQAKWGKDVVIYNTLDGWKYRNKQKYTPTPAFRKLKETDKWIY